MKLLLFILGLTLTAAWSTPDAFLAENTQENYEESYILDLIDGLENFGDADNDNSIGWLFGTTFHINEEGEVHTTFGEENNEEQQVSTPEEESTIEQPEEEETIEEPVEEEEEPVEEEPAEEEEEEEEQVEEDPSDETPVDLLAEVRQDAVASGVFDFGVSTILAKGIKDGKIPNEAFDITAITAYSKTGNKNGDFYKFACESVKTSGSTVKVVKMNFTVYYQFSTQRKTLSSWAYNYASNTTTNPTNNTGFVNLDEAEIAGAEVQGVLNYGTSEIIKNGNAKGKIPVSDYKITKINSVGKKVQTNGKIAYKCDVELQDVKKSLIKTQFIVYVKVSTQEKSLGAWSYHINIKNNGSGNSNNNNSTNNNNTNSTSGTNTTQPTTNTTEPTTNTTEPTTNTTTPNNTTNTTTPTNTTNTTSDGFTDLELSEIQSSAEIQGVLNFGANETLQYGYAKKKIPVSDYKINKIVRVARKAQNNDKNVYKCEIELQDARGVLVKAQFTVTVKVSNQDKFLNKWAYQIFNLRYANRPTNSTGNTNSTNTNNTNTTGTTNTTQPTNTTNTTEPTTNTTEPTTNTTTPNNTTNTTNPANNTNTTVDPYTYLEESEIQSSAEIQGVLNFGVNQTIQYGYAKKKIPVSDYKISKVVKVGRQALSNGRNSYKCEVEVQDAKKVLVKAQFTVTVKVSNQDKFLNSWAYQIFNRSNANKK